MNNHNISGCPPFFSVIIPAYNSAAFLDKGVESVLEQSCQDLELILVDDGSRDNTLALCREYARLDPRVRVFHQENGGHTSARNLGLKNSTGRYIVFLDSDDWLDSQTLQVLQEAALAQSPDILVFGIRVPQTGQVMKNTVPDGVYEGEALKNILNQGLLMDPNGRFILPKSLSGKAFRRETVLENQLTIPGYVLNGEDGACYAACMMDAGKVSVLSGIYYNCLQRDNSVSRSGDRHAISRCLTLLEYYEALFAKKQMDFEDQFHRLTVGMMYTAVRSVELSGCGIRWLYREYRKAVEVETVRESFRKAAFASGAKKMKLKQQILRWGLLWLVGPITRLKQEG